MTHFLIHLFGISVSFLSVHRDWWDGSVHKSKIEIKIKKNILFKKKRILSNFLLQQFLANRLQNWVWQFSFYVQLKWQLSFMVVQCFSMYCIVMVEFGFIWQFIHFSIDHLQLVVFQSIHFHESSPSKNKRNAKKKILIHQTIDILLIRQCVKQKCSICNKYTTHMICKYTRNFKHETQFS